MAAAQAEIERSMGGLDFTLLDPFSGGGSIPLEAQRLGLHARGSDLNPIPVILGSSLIDFPARFCGDAIGQPRGVHGDPTDRTGGAGRRHPVLREVDARAGVRAHRREFPNVEGAGLGPAVAAWIGLAAWSARTRHAATKCHWSAVCSSPSDRKVRSGGWSPSPTRPQRRCASRSFTAAHYGSPQAAQHRDLGSYRTRDRGASHLRLPSARSGQ